VSRFTPRHSAVCSAVDQPRNIIIVDVRSGGTYTSSDAGQTWERS